MWNPLILLVSIAAAAIGWRAGEHRAERRLTRDIGKRVLASLQQVEPLARGRFTRRGVELHVDTRTVWVPIRRLQRLAEFPASVSIHDHLIADIRRAFARRPLELKRKEVADRIVPVVVPAIRVERRDMPRYALSIGEELDLVFAIDGPHSGRWIAEGDVASLGWSDDELERFALANLWRASDGATIVQEARDGQEVYRFAVGDGLDAARVLLRPLWDQIGRRCGSALVYSMPSRDRMYAAPRSQPSSLHRLSEHLTRDWNKRAHTVSPRMWVWRSGRLVPWELHG